MILNIMKHNIRSILTVLMILISNNDNISKIIQIILILQMEVEEDYYKNQEDYHKLINN